jgi:site-specific recombinase XerD
MGGEIQIHKPKTLLENNINSIKQNKEFSNQNKKILLSFQENCITRGLSFFRANKYLYLMKTITKKINKDLNKATKKDIEHFVNWLEKSDYEEATKKDFKVCLKVFFKWLKKPSLVDWVTCKTKKNKSKLPSELLTEADVLKLIDATSHIRNKCFLSVLFESGARISELGSLKLKHVSFDEFGSTILVKGKTGNCFVFQETNITNKQLGEDRKTISVFKGMAS